jgi:hypothetical protein
MRNRVDMRRLIQTINRFQKIESLVVYTQKAIARWLAARKVEKVEKKNTKSSDLQEKKLQSLVTYKNKNVKSSSLQASLLHSTTIISIRDFKDYTKK